MRSRYSMLLGRTVYESRKKLISQGSTPSSASSSSPAAAGERHPPPPVPTHALVWEEGAAGIRSICLGLITLIDRRGASRWKHLAPSLFPARKRQRRREWVVVGLVGGGGGGGFGGRGGDLSFRSQMTRRRKCVWAGEEVQSAD